MEVCSCSPQKSQQFNLIFSGSPYRHLGQGRLDNYPERAMQMQSLAPIPDYRHSPPHSTASVTLCTATRASRSATGVVINGTGLDGCLPELDMFPLLLVMCLWYMCFCAEVFFFCSQTVLQMEHSLGLNNFFFFLLSLLM